MSRSRISKAIGITMGDPAGVGSEVVAKALQTWRPPRGVDVLVIGNQDIFEAVWPKKKIFPSFLHLESARRDYKPGRPTDVSGRDSLLYLDKGIEMVKSGALNALVTGPVSKEQVSKFVPKFKGHTTYLANAFQKKDVEMLFVARDLKMVLVTRHIAIKEVPSHITRAKVKSVITATYDFLQKRFKIKKPKIAVCGLNPHAGEQGHMGREDIDEILPAVKDLQKKGWAVHGPLAADTLFEPRNRKGYDLIVTMYHDQGLTALKSQYFSELVNLTVGLPFIRTSPAHGTAFGIAGQGVADHGSMLAAIQLAAELA